MITITLHENPDNIVGDISFPWWRHQMETFSALLAVCAGNSPVPMKSPHKDQWRGALMFSLICAWINDCKQPWGWWFETPSWSLWRQCNARHKPYTEHAYKPCGNFRGVCLKFREFYTTNPIYDLICVTRLNIMSLEHWTLSQKIMSPWPKSYNDEKEVWKWLTISYHFAYLIT